MPTPRRAAGALPPPAGACARRDAGALLILVCIVCLCHSVVRAPLCPAAGRSFPVPHRCVRTAAPFAGQSYHACAWMGAEDGVPADAAALRQRKPTVLTGDAAGGASPSPSPGPKMVSPLAGKPYEPYVPPSPYAEHPYSWPLRLFFAAKFAAHRALGLAYLAQYCALWALYARSWPAFAASPLIVTLPLSGLAQSLTAAFYFRFLPRARADPGYYADRGTISYQFVLENIFSAAILAWQWLYMNERIFGPAARAAAHPAARAAMALAEAAWTFLPYMVFRPLVPKTRFRDGLSNDGNKTSANATFLYVGTLVTKVFYLWAKWFLGFFLNYLRFLDLLTDDDRRELYRMLLFSAFATTISVFLHTLKFKVRARARARARSSVCARVLLLLHTPQHHLPSPILFFAGLHRRKDELWHLHGLIPADLLVHGRAARPLLQARDPRRHLRRRGDAQSLRPLDYGRPLARRARLRLPARNHGPPLRRAGRRRRHARAANAAGVLILLTEYHYKCTTLILSAPRPLKRRQIFHGSRLRASRLNICHSLSTLLSMPSHCTL